MSITKHIGTVPLSGHCQYSGRVDSWFSNGKLTKAEFPQDSIELDEIEEENKEVLNQIRELEALL